MGKKFVTGLEKGSVKHYGKDKVDIKGNRSERFSSAQSWVEKIKTTYENEYLNALTNTSIVEDSNDSLSSKLSSYCGGNTKVQVFKVGVSDAVKAAIEHSDGRRVCVLNFASHSNPGGGFIKGSRAQEEALCHVSALYPVLSDPKFKSYYTVDTDEDSYDKMCIYSADMPFIIGRKVYHADVITMAAVNQRSKKMWNNPEAVMRRCMEFAYLYPAMREVEILLLGAWGCGVFGNSPEFVASTWKELQEEYKGLYRVVTHPILDLATYKVFKDVMTAS